MTIPSGKKLKARIIIIAVLALVIFLLTVLADYPQTIERYYSQGLYPVICMVLHPILNIFPFSVGDVLYVLVVACLLYCTFIMFKRLFKKRFRGALQMLLGLVIGMQTGIIIFYVFWGMNYFRPSAAERLNMPDTVYNIAELKAATRLLIDSANASRNRLTKADVRQTNDSIYSNAIRATNMLSATSVNFRTYSPGIKPSLLTPFINYLGTSGYYNPFTGEAQINYLMPVFMKPFVACHELSHQVGFGPEDEANFAGSLAAVNSPDRLMRYSAYYEGMTEFMYALRATDSLEYKSYKKRISANVLRDLKAEHAYWKYYAGRLEVISSLFYDSYLKVNNQPQGLMTYNKMVTLVLAWYRRSLVTGD